MPREASDSEQLLGATAQGRVLFTFNVHDFPILVQHYPHHGGKVAFGGQIVTVKCHEDNSSRPHHR